jgi:hypothetical protein
MSTGTGIFLASIVIALVLVYLKTRDQWQLETLSRVFFNYKRIIFQLMAASAIIVFLVYLTKWTQAYIKKAEATEARTKIEQDKFRKLQEDEYKKKLIQAQEIAEKKQKIEEEEAIAEQFSKNLANEKARLESPGESMPHQINYGGFFIGMSKKDRVYKHGNGVKMIKDKYHTTVHLMETFWFDSGEHCIYNQYSDPVKIFVRVNQDKIDALAIEVYSYGNNTHYERVCSNCGKNRKKPHNIDGLKEKFGQPSKEIHSEDDTKRIYYFDDYGIAAVLSSDVIRFVVIYDPASTKR